MISKSSIFQLFFFCLFLASQILCACPDGSGSNPSNPDKCLSCSVSRCVDCKDDYTKCKACNLGYGLDLDGKCSKCSTGCLECSTNASFCTKCLSLYFFNKGGECKQCPQSCDVCTSETFCDKCRSGYYPNNGNCEICPIGCSACNSEQIVNHVEMGITLKMAFARKTLKNAPNFQEVSANCV